MSSMQKETKKKHNRHDKIFQQFAKFASCPIDDKYRKWLWDIGTKNVSEVLLNPFLQYIVD